MAGDDDSNSPPKVTEFYSNNVPMLELKLGNRRIARRKTDDYINATHILRAAGFETINERSSILEQVNKTVTTDVVRGGYAIYQGTYIPLPDARALAKRYRLDDNWRPIFETKGKKSPTKQRKQIGTYTIFDSREGLSHEKQNDEQTDARPQIGITAVWDVKRNREISGHVGAPSHIGYLGRKQGVVSHEDFRRDENKRKNPSIENPSPKKPRHEEPIREAPRREGPGHNVSSNFTPINKSVGSENRPNSRHERNDASPDTDVDDDATVEQSSNESVGGEDTIPASQHDPPKRRKVYKRPDDAAIMARLDQEHIHNGNQLMDYLMTTGGTRTRKRPPPKPQGHFQVNWPIDDSGYTALHWASAIGNMVVVQALIEKGAHVEVLSIHEETPLIRAIHFTNNYENRTFPELLKLLIAVVFFRDWFGATIFHHIAETTAWSKRKRDSSEYYCKVLLKTLCETCKQEEIDVLLSVQNSDGDTAALIAARNGAPRLVNMLLSHCGRSGDLINKNGETARAIYERTRTIVAE